MRVCLEPAHQIRTDKAAKIADRIDQADADGRRDTGEMSSRQRPERRNVGVQTEPDHAEAEHHPTERVHLKPAADRQSSRRDENWHGGMPPSISRSIG